MNKAERTEIESAWQQLRKQVEEDPLKESFGLDLLRGRSLKPYCTLEHLHMQVQGDDAFLRNMLQRILIWDLDQFVPVFFIASDDETGLLEEITKIMAEEGGRNNVIFLYSRSRPKLSIKSFHLPHLFEKKMFDTLTLRHLYVEMGEKTDHEDGRLLSKLGAEIQRHFPFVEEPWVFKPRKPFVYLIYPEKLASKFPLNGYIERLADYVSFRVLTENVKIFGNEEASLVYGPGVYPVESCERMRDYCYKHLSKHDHPYYLTGKEYRKELKAAKELAKSIPLDQTAFGRFKSWYRPGREYAWFYPVKQNLGRTPYECPSEALSWEQKPESPVIGEPNNAAGSPAVRKILEDLRPRR